ncbi:MAG TPA: sugar ABC transporter substrate-binding protein [Vicinamibacterales bacterium]
MSTVRLAVALLLAAAAVACGASDSTPQRPVVALVMKSLANEFFRTMEEGARRHQEAHAAEYELIATGIKDEQDVARQIGLVEQMIARRVAAIVLAPADSRALVAVTRRAVDAGIVVVNIDNRLDAGAMAERGLQVPFVGPDNRKGARAVGAYVAARLRPGDPIAILEGAPNAFNGIQRKLGFEDAAREAGLAIVRSQTAFWETSRANQVVSSLIAERPDVKAILCANDSMALGAVAALRAAGRAGSVLIAGFDNISAAAKLVRSGEMVATADQHGDQLAVYGIEYALERIRNPEAPLADRETPVDLITADTP